MKQQLNQAKEKMQKTLDSLSREFAAVRAGRANPDILNKVQAEYWGAMTPVTQMASVSVPDARTLLVQPYDATALKAIEKAIMNSDIGINPNNDGKAIRLTFPQLTEERRKELCKSCKKYGEEAKVAIRSIRRDVMDKFKTMKKNSELTEDEMKQGEKDLQKIVDKFCEDTDKMVAAKEKEILSI
ncbi:MAG: ribosome recycling factor [Oscillospiraceae bacterium]|nr:ribosome recycling factor [Oscillospiraceae bacterium]